MELHEALAQIAEIRQQMAQTHLFRGYRSVTTAISGAVAVLAAVAQPWLVPDPQQQLWRYLALWLTAAAISVGVVAVAILLRHRRCESDLERQVTYLAVEQFVPSLVAGSLLTYLLATCSPDAAWVLPGIWAMLMGLGILASRRLLPAATGLIGAYYLGAGALCLALARGPAAFSPWAMGLCFGVGQLASSAVLYWTLEHNHE